MMIRMRAFLIFFSIVFFTTLLSLGLGAMFLANKGVLSESWFAFALKDTGSRFSRVAGVSTGALQPVLSERRIASSEFRPLKKPGVGIFAAPTAHAAILLDADTEMALYESSPDERRGIASITKLFTAMIVVEEIDNLDEMVTIGEEALSAEGTRVGCPRSGYCIGERLQLGEKISVRNLLKAALMNSANDAAIALAVHTDGSEEKFVKRMNKRAQDLGMNNSHFCTASGLELDGNEESCYSSARDIAMVAVQALKYEVLWSIMRMEETTISSSDGKYVHTIFNTDRLLGQYSNLIGAKTGFTPRAGYSLLAVAGDPETGAHKLIAVVLDDSSRWTSVQEMFAFGFDSFEWR